MLFGYKNSPSIFQCIMKNTLAPFLWIFALVYIDDIIIFSLTLENHISHLDQVFQAIEKSGVTQFHESSDLTVGARFVSKSLTAPRVQRLYHSLDRACFCLNKLFDQAKESMWGMPRYTEAMKAVVSCDKPGGAAHKL